MSREMKQSGIEWIGEIPSDWKISRNKNCFELKKNIVSEKHTEYKLLSLTKNGIVIKDINNSFGKTPESYKTYQDVKQGQIVLCLFDLDCSAVFSGLSNYDGMISPAYKVYNCKDCIDKNYAKYWFEYCFDGRKYIIYSKSLRYVVNADDFGTIEIILPPISEQQKIADFLDSKVTEIDKVISETKSIIENYKKYKQAVITEAVTKGLDKTVEMKDSGIEWIGKIPFGWNVINPKALFSLRKDKAKEGERQLTASQQYGVIYQDEYMRITETRIVTVEKDFSILKHVEKGDFVISMRSFQGGIEYSENTGSISSAYVMLIPNLNYVFPPFYKWLLKSSGYINALQSTSNLVRDGQAMRYSNFIQVPLYTVPIDEQKIIAEYLDTKCSLIDKLIAEKEKLLINLEEYKKSLIYEYITGKKEVTGSKSEENIVVTIPVFPAVFKASSKRFAQAVLMSKILDTSNNNKGRVKLEKTLYTIEHHIGFDFETEYTREAAGPLDKSLYKCEAIISRKNRWFNINTNNRGVSYRPAKDIQKYKNYYNNYFADYNAEIERIIGIFDDFSTDQAEIIATLYGAWNDFVIDKKTFTDEDVVNEVLNNWHDSKKRFPKDVWLRAMDNMRTFKLVPKGYGKHTRIKGV